MNPHDRPQRRTIEHSYDALAHEMPLPRDCASRLTDRRLVLSTIPENTVRKSHDVR